MAAFMAWVHRKFSLKNESVAVSLIALSLILGFLGVVELSNSQNRDSASGVQIQPIRSCFNEPLML
jgi:hypothetical protein